MTMASPDIETIIVSTAARFAQLSEEVVRSARSEEDIRQAWAQFISAFIDEAGLTLKARHEYALAGGRIDSKYAGVIIEYKHPRGSDKLTSSIESHGCRRSVAQLEERFTAFEKNENLDAERVFGVGTDGRYIIFVTYSNGKFDVRPPKLVSETSIERLLRAIVSLGATGKSYTPAELALDFGTQGEVSRTGVRVLLDSLQASSSPKVSALFNEWKLLFGEASGFDAQLSRAKVANLFKVYGLKVTGSAAELLFCIHTFYALFMKLLAAEIVSSFAPLPTSLVRRLASIGPSTRLLHELTDIEDGGIWSQVGIGNFLEGDLFSWYVSAWNEDLAVSIRDLSAKLDEYDPSTLSVDPDESRDLLKKLYQELLPRTVRHDLGEFYTPDWLASYTLHSTTYDGDPEKRVLDPCCGSGTFLVLAINRAKQWFRSHRTQCGYDERELLTRIVRSIVGFDLNPLAVLAARTNYLVAVRDLLKFSPGIDIPVYLSDSIVAPYDHSTSPGGFTFHYTELKTSVGSLKVPKEATSTRLMIEKYASALEFCIRHNFTVDEFLNRCEQEEIPTERESLHKKLFLQFSTLNAEGRNGIWARIIKNAFAPIWVGQFDYVVGNPPWINWESLPEHYRGGTIGVWKEYGLFTLSGSAARLGGGKKDISMLFVYVAVDNYLRAGGTLCIVITQTVFKSSEAGEGFRRFEFSTKSGDKVFIKPVRVDDLSSFKPFEGASNQTAVLLATKTDRPWSYPVPYVSWSKRGVLSDDSTLEVALDATLRETREAAPIDAADRSSSWLTAPSDVIGALRKVLGASAYEAHEGANTGGLNGCFYIRILEPLPSGKVLVRNVSSRGRKDVPDIVQAIEPDLVFPLLLGRDIEPWHSDASLSIVLAQDVKKRRGIPESEMRRSFPLTYSYLCKFRSGLEGRKSSSLRRLMEGGAFYSMFGVGPYTLAKWKVVWKEQPGREGFCASVVGPVSKRPVVPNHKVMLIAVKSEREANFVVGLLSSSPAHLAITSYVLPTSASTHVAKVVRLPKFDPRDSTHLAIAKEVARLRNSGTRPREREAVQLDQFAAKLWGITDAELKSIRGHV